MKRDEFERNLSQLLNLLKKLLKSKPGGEIHLPHFLDSKHADSVTFNLCFFNFIPISEEEMEEFEEAVANAFEQESDVSEGADGFSWDDNDIEFLKRHGMTF